MESFTQPLVSQPSRETLVQQVLDEHRSTALDALDDLMYEAFLEVGRILAERDPDARIGGLSPFSLRQIRRHCAAGDLADWLSAGADGDKSLYLRDFLDLGRMQMTEFKARYPRAFTKWTPEEDDALLNQYQQESQDGRAVSWSGMAAVFGRNPNALRLRLEHLGVRLGSDAGRPRFRIGAAQ